MQDGFCRDENCSRIDLHLVHIVEMISEQPEPPSLAKRPPWRSPAPKALDHSIAKATSRTYPRHFDAILHEVEADYGDCNPRTVQRGLRKLVERGHILRIDLGRHLYAYVRPGSKLVNDIDLLREQIFDLFATSASATET